jgi:hypothetical protein
MIAEALLPVARRVRVLTLPGLPEKGDVVDWVAAGGTAEEFARLVATAPDYVRNQDARPQPLMREMPPPEIYPLEALRTLAPVVQAVQERVQSPVGSFIQWQSER